MLQKLKKHFYITGRERDYERSNVHKKTLDPKTGKEVDEVVKNGKNTHRLKTNINWDSKMQWDDAGCFKYMDHYDEPAKYSMMTVSYVNKRFFELDGGVAVKSEGGARTSL